MDSLQKLAHVANESMFEVDGEPSFAPKIPVSPGCGWTNKQLQELYGHHSPADIVQAKGHPVPIHLAAVPGGRKFPLLKVMLTTACERHCLYCPFQAGRDHQRVSFTPDELAQVVMQAHRAGWIEGVFLSTGLFNGGANTQNKILDTAEILRFKLRYTGYLHIKIMPGAEQGQVLRAMQLADRVSTNLEAPNRERLQCLAPEKDFESELLNPLQWAQHIRKNKPNQLGWQGRWPSTSTQFVVGPAGETDVELLSTVDHLYRQLRLKRVYFEAFSPVIGTPMETQPAENPLRQQRLYEASFLLRDYGFSLEELPFTHSGKLPLERDPKQAYADFFMRELLIRVPGIGPQTADRIIALRREGLLKDIDLLRTKHLITERSAPYITVDGRRPSHQKVLF